jgi:hypothetical protein
VLKALIQTRGLPITSSLRELFAIVLFFAMGLAALKTGGVLAGLILIVAGLLSMAMAIVAFVGIGAPKAYAVGFILPVTIYAVCVAIGGQNELDPYDAKLPTAHMLRYAHQKLVTKAYIDPVTGKVIPDFDPAAQARSSTITGGMMGMSGFGPGIIGPSLLETPDRPTFMLLAHTLLALILGWLGAKFAMRVYRLQHPLQSHIKQNVAP